MGVVDFSRKINTNVETTGFQSVVFGANGALLEVELNEMQALVNERLRKFLKSMFGDCCSQDALYVIDNNVFLNGTFIIDGYLFTNSDPIIVDISETNQLYLGYKIETITGADKVHKDGIGNEDEIDNTIIDTRVGIETSRREILSVKLVADGTSLPDDYNSFLLVDAGEPQIRSKNIDSVVTYCTEYVDKLVDSISTSIRNLTSKTDNLAEDVDEINSNLSNQLGSHTVKSDVPENAVFTDTVYDDTEVQKRISYNGYGEVAGGKNLLNYNIIDSKTNHCSVLFKNDTFYATNKGSYSAFAISVPTVVGKSYTVTIKDWSDYSYRCITSVSDTSDNTLVSTVIMDATFSMTFTATSNESFINFSPNNTSSAMSNTITFKCMLEEGSVATEYEPYFPSNKMIAEENSRQYTEMKENIAKVNSGLFDLQNGGKNLFDGMLKQGAYNENGNFIEGNSLYVSTITPISCNENSKMLFNINAKKSVLVFANWYGTNGFIKRDRVDNVISTEFIVPVGATNVKFSVGGYTDTYVSDVVYLTVYIDNVIYQLYIGETDLKMLGWSVPRECPIQNEVNGNQFIQKVGRVDLGSLAYTYDSNTIQFYSDVVSSLPQESKWNYNLYCNKYPTGSTSSDSYIASYGGRIYIRDKNYTDTSAFKQAMQGQYLYYELATYNTMTIDGNEIGETVSDVRKETTVNLLKPTLKTTTVNGITCTNNGDGTYTLNGKATSTTALILQENVSWDAPKRLTGCPKGGDSYKYYLDLLKVSSGAQYMDIGEGTTITQSNSGSLRFVILENQTITNAIIKPMITTNLDATYDDFVPYTGDTGKLNSDVAEIKKDLSKLQDNVDSSDIQYSAYIKNANGDITPSGITSSPKINEVVSQINNNIGVLLQGHNEQESKLDNIIIEPYGLGDIALKSWTQGYYGTNNYITTSNKHVSTTNKLKCTEGSTINIKINGTANSITVVFYHNNNFLGSSVTTNTGSASCTAPRLADSFAIEVKVNTGITPSSQILSNATVFIGFNIADRISNYSNSWYLLWEGDSTSATIDLTNKYGGYSPEEICIVYWGTNGDLTKSCTIPMYPIWNEKINPNALWNNQFNVSYMRSKDNDFCILIDSSKGEDMSLGGFEVYARGNMPMIS